MQSSFRRTAVACRAFRGPRRQLALQLAPQSAQLARRGSFCQQTGQVRCMGFFDSFKKTVKEEMDNPELKQQLDSLQKATDKLRQTKVGGKTVEDVASDLGKSAEQAKVKMRDMKDSAAEEYSSKASDSFQDSGGKFENTAETVTKGAAAAKETFQDAYTQAQESVQRETEKLEADNEDFKTAKEKITRAADDAQKMQSKLFGDNFFSNFKTELAATAKELFSSDAENKSVNKVLRAHEPPAETTDTADTADVESVSESSLMVVDQPQTNWEKINERLQESPIIQGILGQARKASKSDVGQGAKAASNKIKDASDDAREFWETSQNPWVYRVSNIYDGLFGETELSTAIRELRIADPEFNIQLWAEVVQAQCLPQILEAYLRGDGKALGVWCSERMVRTVEQVQQERAAAGLSADPNILDIEEVTIVGAQVDERGPPIILLQGTAQQVHCLRNSKGEIVEGAEDNIEQCYYYFAFQRNLDEADGELKWECVEFVPILKQAYY